jgi:hypothetical protein
MGLQSSQALYQLALLFLLLLALCLWRKSVAAFCACHYQCKLYIRGDAWKGFQYAHSLIIIDKSVCIPSLSEYWQSISPFQRNAHAQLPFILHPYPIPIPK